MRCARTLVVATMCLVLLGLGAGSAGADTHAGSAPQAPAKPTLVTGSGDISYRHRRSTRRCSGTDNGGAPQSFPSGRREINWDAVPDEFAEPNGYPPDFFNAPAAPRARGVVLSTPGERLGVSADSDNPAGAAVRFGDINPTYPKTFRTHSAERSSPRSGSNVANIKFFVPGTTTPALVRGFGAVYTDVDSKEAAAFTFFDAKGTSSARIPVPKSKDGPVVPRRGVQEAGRGAGARSCTERASSDPTTARSTTSR